RAVARLERALETPLFRRSTRSIRATTAGHAYFDSCSRALETLTQAADRLSTGRESLKGRVRVSVPTTFGHRRFLPILPEFRRLHPGVQIDVHIANRNIDFVREPFDLAIRLNRPRDGAFVARKLGDFSLGVFASPDYLAERGRPTEPSELVEHECASFIMPSTGRELPWTFSPQPESWRPVSPVRIREDVLGLITFARAGGGLIQIYHFLVQAELDRGELVEVLEPFGGRQRPFYLLYPKEVMKNAPARALAEFVLRRSRADAASVARKVLPVV
ncbi:MAG: LysR substrate-binding domain-containing protein, partial [Myxococcota bacterium]